MPQWTITLNDKVLKQFTITDGSSLTIGRSADADVVVDNTAISRKHTSLGLKDGIYYLSDLGSLNGTFVNGQKIEKNVPVSENDRI
ncbi:MAG: FHA domain-containing protein, partial [Desulfobulbaceae bacterium]|nr:FHA domain-containing protein [Desulfobulbaceae bacterium]